MNEIKLRTKDYQQIFDFAIDEWNNSKEKDANLALCKAYVQAFLFWTEAKGYDIIDGKVVDE